MTFATEVVKQGRGRALRFDFSYDDFATVAYRLSDIEGKLDGTNWYLPRVVSVGSFRRALGQSRIAAAGGVEVVIANHDGAYDSLASRDAINDIAALRVRAYLVLYDPAAPTSFASRQLGEYVCDRWPTRNDATLRMSLVDDILGPLAAGVVLPTFQDWAAVGSSSNNPLYNGAYFSDVNNYFTPLQLAFGEDWVLAYTHVVPRSPHSNYYDEVIVPLCCTNDTSTAASDSEVTQVRVQLWKEDGGIDGPVVDLPYSYTNAGDHLWTVQRSPTITKDGKSFVVIYLRANITAFQAYMSTRYPHLLDIRVPAPGATQAPDTRPWYALLGGYGAPVLTSAGGTTNSAYLYTQAMSRVARWWVKGKPLSARTQTTQVEQHACDILKDLVTHYTKATLAVDSTSHSKVKAMRSGARAAGVVQPWTADAGGGRKAVTTTTLRSVLTQLCQSSDLDIFVNWSGDVAFATDGYSFELAEALYGGTLVQLEEAKLLAIEEWVPSHGERGAPFNRLYLDGGKASPADGLPVPFQGPWDFDGNRNTSIQQSSRIIDATMQQGWRPYVQQAFAPWGFRVLEVECRSRIRFRYPLDALQLELGDYFYLPWARNLSTPYSDATLWQVDSITYAPDSDTVEVEAAWRNSLVGDKGYLLDDENMALRVAATFGRTATVTDSSTTVAFSSGSLITDGVAAGDILVLQDSTLAEDDFTRFRAVRIASITDATHLVITSGDLDFGSPGGVAVADWTIYRGATTYHTAVSDPTNYPSGGAMYGKVTDATGQFSDASTGNKLLDG